MKGRGHEINKIKEERRNRKFTYSSVRDNEKGRGYEMNETKEERKKLENCFILQYFTKYITKAKSRCHSERDTGIIRQRLGNE